MKNIRLICLLGVAALLFGIVPALAETETNTGSATGTTYPSAEVKAVPPIESTKAISENIIQGSGKEYFACMAKATSAREDSFLSGFNTFNSSAASAYSARKTALASAWTSSDNREIVQKAVNSVESAFRDSFNTAQKQWNITQQTITKKFNEDRVACVKLSTPQSTTGQATSQSLIERIKQLEAQIKELMLKLNASGVKTTQPAPQPTIQPTTPTSTSAY